MPSSPPIRPLARAQDFAAHLGIELPILLAPMAGASAPSLSIAVANAGGMGACGAVLMQPEAILQWAKEFRSGSRGIFQLNLWVPESAPARDPEAERRQREFLSGWGPAVSAEMGDSVLPDFAAQCEALLAARPRAISSVMGIYSPAFVAQMKSNGILWIATATTVAEAQVAAAAGADAILAQGAEAGGHRGSFDPHQAETRMIGLMALLPQIADAVSVPVIAAGGIADGRGVAAALTLGASAVAIGTGFLRTPEARIPPAYAERIAQTEAEHTRLTRAFSGRPGRAIRNQFVEATSEPGAPPAAPYPVQRGFTRRMREEAARAGDSQRMQMWAGQAARMAKPESAETLTRQIWTDAQALLS